MTPRARYLSNPLKLSGEASAARKGVGIDADAVRAMALQIQEVKELGVEIVIVIGGGNNLSRTLRQRGRHRAGHRRLHGNAGDRHQLLALQDALEKLNVATRVQTAISMQQMPNRSSAGAPSDISRKDASSSCCIEMAVCTRVATLSFRAHPGGPGS